MAITRTINWTLLTDSSTAVRLVTEAVAQTDFVVSSATTDGIIIDVPRAVMKNRWAATITGAVTAAGDRTHIEWSVDGLGDKHYAHMISIAEGLPEGVLFDHGIPDAASKVALKFFGRREIGHLANVLDRDEMVLALGVGNLGGKMGIVALTGQRLIFLEKSIGSESMVEYSLSAIGALSLGKKMGGETLTVAHSGTQVTITTLGHGQGEAITRKFRDLRAGQAAPAAQAGSTPDPIEQIERLAGLRDKGILTEEEFQQRKAQLLESL